jgi:hypothetical protein
VADVHKNENTLLFVVQSHENGINEKPKVAKNAQDFFYYNIDNTFKRDGVYLNIPKGVLQSDINFEFKAEENNKYYSNIYKIHREDEGLLASYNLKIKLQKFLFLKYNSHCVYLCRNI